MEADDLMKLLMSHKAACLSCGTTIEFEEAAGLALDLGINDKVVVCKQCRHIFEVQLGPQGMQLTADVTDRYA